MRKPILGCILAATILAAAGPAFAWPDQPIKLLAK